jgi:sensor histidine kinase YesM
VFEPKFEITSIAKVNFFMLTKNKIISNVIICLIFLALPILITPHHKTEFGSRIGDYLIVRKIVTNFSLLLFSFANYYFIIPKLYFKKKQLQFIIALIVSLILCLLPDIILNQFSTSKHHFTYFVNAQITLFLFISIFFITYSIKINQQLSEIQIGVKNAQLSFLKGQINPHFLFNTLNSIYSLAVTKSDEAPSAIVKLSNMMRYTVTEVENEFVTLEKEIQFLDNYIALQKIRLGNTCYIDFKFENKNPNEKIIPMLFIPFVENAFKYGISAEEKALIQIEIINSDGALEFKIYNKKLNKNPQETSTAIGISNTKKRLDLLYLNQHNLKITETANTFLVDLKIKQR